MNNFNLQPTNIITIFDDIFSDMEKVTKKNPLYNVIEDSNQFTIEVELAGIDKKDITINIDENKLIVDAERKINSDNKYNWNGIIANKFNKSFTLPDDINIDDIESKLQNGILIIKIPKKINKPEKKRKISIS